MRIVETYHFKDRWSRRVGKINSNELRKLIYSRMELGEARRHAKSELGVLVPINYKGRSLGVVGIPTKKEFILKTVINPRIAHSMGWGYL